MEIKCPKCSEQQLAVICNKNEENQLHCMSCDEDFSLADLDEMTAMIAKLKDWIAKAPFMT